MGTRPEKCCLQNSNANSHVAQVMSDQRDVTCNITRDLISDPLVEKTDPIWNVSHIFDDFASCFRRKFQTKVTRFVPECPAPHRAGMDQSWCSVPAGVNGRNRFLTLSDLDLSKWMQIFCQTKKLRSKTVAFWVQNTRSDESTRDKKISYPSLKDSSVHLGLHYLQGETAKSSAMPWRAGGGVEICTPLSNEEKEHPPFCTTCKQASFTKPRMNVFCRVGLRMIRPRKFSKMKGGGWSPPKS